MHWPFFYSFLWFHLLALYEKLTVESSKQLHDSGTVLVV